MLQELQECRECNKILPLIKFHHENKNNNTFHDICKDCMSDYQRKLRIRRKSDKLCVRCGKQSKNSSVLCINCSKKDTTRMYEKRKENKIKAVEYLGGFCKRCGLKSEIMAIYDFHHVDTTKEKRISKILNKSWNRIKKELDKCKLVCSNCHRIIHSDDSYRPIRRRLHDTQFSKGHIRYPYSQGNFKGIRKGTISSHGLIGGGTGNGFRVYDWKGTRTFKTTKKIKWLSKKFFVIEERAKFPNHTSMVVPFGSLRS
jgi:hypothetical protein